MSAALFELADFDRRPDLPGVVHGIVSLDPPRIQCDGCGHVHEGAPGRLALAVIVSGIRFNPRRYAAGTDRRRLCESCASSEWKDEA